MNVQNVTTPSLAPTAFYPELNAPMTSPAQGPFLVLIGVFGILAALTFVICSSSVGYQMTCCVFKSLWKTWDASADAVETTAAYLGPPPPALQVVVVTLESLRREQAQSSQIQNQSSVNLDSVLPSCGQDIEAPPGNDLSQDSVPEAAAAAAPAAVAVAVAVPVNGMDDSSLPSLAIPIPGATNNTGISCLEVCQMRHDQSPSGAVPLAADIELSGMQRRRYRSALAHAEASLSLVSVVSLADTSPSSNAGPGQGPGPRPGPGPGPGPGARGTTNTAALVQASRSSLAVTPGQEGVNRSNTLREVARALSRVRQFTV